MSTSLQIVPGTRVCSCCYRNKRTCACSQDAQSSTGLSCLWVLIFPCFPLCSGPTASSGSCGSHRKSESTQQTPKAEINAAEKVQVGGAKKNHRLMSRPKVRKAECGLHSSFFSWMIFMYMNHMSDAQQTWNHRTGVSSPWGSRTSYANSSPFRGRVRVHNGSSWGQPTRESFRKTTG